MDIMHNHWRWMSPRPLAAISRLSGRLAGSGPRTFKRNLPCSCALLLVSVFSIEAFAGPNEDLVEAAQRGDVAKAASALDRGARMNDAYQIEKGMTLPDGSLLILRYTPLEIAARNDRKNVVELLLRHGADPNQSIPSDSTALAEAASVGAFDVVTTLFDHGAIVDGRDAKGTTALMSASVSGNLDMVAILIGRGADVNARDLLGMTSLHDAAMLGKTDAVSKLLKFGADPNLKDDRGWTPLDFASDMSDDPVDREKKTAIIALLQRQTPVTSTPPTQAPIDCRNVPEVVRRATAIEPNASPEVILRTVHGVQVELGCRAPDPPPRPQTTECGWEFGKWRCTTE